MIRMIMPKCSARRRMKVFKVSGKAVNNDTILYRPFLSLYNNLYKSQLYIYIYICVHNKTELVSTRLTSTGKKRELQLVIPSSKT